MRIANQEIKGIKLIKYNKVKVCSKCGQEKPLTKFGKRKNSKDGHRNECLECAKIYKKKYRNGESTKRQTIKVGITKICKQCNQEKDLSEFYKDKGCKDGYRATCKICVEENKTKYNLVCKYCGKDFSNRDKTQRFCSTKCMGLAKVTQVEFVCEYCGKTSSMEKGLWKRNSKHHFCSRKCADSFRTGENHPRWNPNLTDEERNNYRLIDGYKEWVISVFEKDNYTCQCCGDNKGHNLKAHHLNGYNWDIEHRTDVNNGITLCENCHKEFHHIYGYGNNTKEQFEEFINNKTNKTA